MRALTPDIFIYKDYRKFLADFVVAKKKDQPRWSLGQWARTLDLKATTSISMILNGQREPGPQVSRALAEYFQFSHEQKNYFYSLIELSKVPKQSFLKEVLQLEISSRAKRGAALAIDPAVFSKLTQWYCIVLKQMARCGKLTANLDKAASMLVCSVPVSKIKDAIKTLLKIKYIRLNENSLFLAEDINISTENDVPRSCYKDFHEQMINLGKTSVRSIDVDRREISGLTLPIKKSSIPRAKELIRRFVDDFDELLDDSTGEAIYQLNVQFFPLADFEQIGDANKDRACQKE